MKILNTKSIYYNDVNLIAQLGVVQSRADVPRELNRIIVSPMMAVVGKTFAVQAARLGLTVCLHRFGTKESERDIYEAIDHDFGNRYDRQNVYCSVGLNDLDRVKYLVAFSGVRQWCLDIASGYLPQLAEKINDIIQIAQIDSLIIGNVHTKEGVDYLNEICDSFGIYKRIIRCGIGGGSACQTSDTSGYNRGQITELSECHKTESNSSFYIAADGGIKNGNYAAKAFGCGADFCMMGGYFKNALESQTNLDGDGTYWGGASHKQQEKCGGITRHSEGKIIMIKEELKPLRTLVDELWGGISSYVSYSGYKTLTQAIGNGVFEIKTNSLPPQNRV